MLPVTMVDSKGNTVTGVKDIEANGYTSILSIKPTTTGTEGNLSQTAGIYVTGYNNYGQLFNQDTKTLTSLTKVQEDKNIITMASTQNISSQTAAIVDDSGLVYTVGYNGFVDQIVKRENMKPVLGRILKMHDHVHPDCRKGKEIRKSDRTEPVQKAGMTEKKAGKKRIYNFYRGKDPRRGELNIAR